MFTVKTICAHGFRNLDVRLNSDNLSSEVVYEGQQILEDGDILFYKEYADSTYTYGLIQSRDNYHGHDKGYIWSSRASVINKVFNLNLVDIAINGVCRAFPVMLLELILPKGFVLKKRRFNNGEEYWSVELTDGSTPKCGTILYGGGNPSNPVYNLTTVLQQK